MSTKKSSFVAGHGAGKSPRGSGNGVGKSSSLSGRRGGHGGEKSRGSSGRGAGGKGASGSGASKSPPAKPRVSIGAWVCRREKIDPPLDMKRWGLEEKFSVNHYGRVTLRHGEDRVDAEFLDMGGFGRNPHRYTKTFKISDHRYKFVAGPPDGYLGVSVPGGAVRAPHKPARPVAAVAAPDATSRPDPTAAAALPKTYADAVRAVGIYADAARHLQRHIRFTHLQTTDKIFRSACL